MDPQLTAAWIGAGATLVAAVVAALIVMVQLGRQSRDAINQTRHNERLKLKLAIYQEILSICEKQGDAARAVATKLSVLRHGTLPVWREPHRFGGFRPKAPISFPELVALVGEANKSGIAVITLTEQWRIVDRRLDLFSDAVSAAIHDLRVMWEEIHPKLAATLPPICPDINGTLPAPEKLQEIENGCERLIDRLETLSAWVMDFQREMQNLLLSELFDHTIPAREPLDPRHIAVSLAKYESQKAYFESQTAWGLWVTEAEERLKAELANQPTAAKPRA